MMSGAATETTAQCCRRALSRRTCGGAACMRQNQAARGRALKGSEMPSWQRYFMSSNSPSGGTKLTTFSVLKRPRFTHWCSVTSCGSAALPRQLPQPALSPQVQASGMFLDSDLLTQ